MMMTFIFGKREEIDWKNDRKIIWSPVGIMNSTRSMSVRIPGAPRIATNLEIYVVYSRSDCDRFCRSHNGSPCYCSRAEKTKERGTCTVPLTESVRYNKETGEVNLCTMPEWLPVAGYYEAIPRTCIESATVRSKLPAPIWE